MLNKLFPSTGKAAEPVPDRQYALGCIPMTNPECETTTTAEGLQLHYPVQVKPWLRKIFTAASNRHTDIIIRKLQLDAMGTEVWQMIDGHATVLEISRKFARRHQLPEREAEIPVSEFIQQLGRRGLIALKEPEG